jgi:hypothetical protein
MSAWRYIKRPHVFPPDDVFALETPLQRVEIRAGPPHCSIGPFFQPLRRRRCYTYTGWSPGVARARLDLVNQNLFCVFSTDCPFWGICDTFQCSNPRCKPTMRVMLIQQLERAEQEMAQLKARIEELCRNFMDVITPNGKTRRGGAMRTSPWQSR